MNTHRNKIALAIITAAGLSMAPLTVMAGALPVSNGDFQLPSLPTDGQTSSGGPTGWGGSSALGGGLMGVWNPTSGSIFSEGGGTNQVAFADLNAYLDGALFVQSLPWTVQNGDKFTVHLRVAKDPNFPLPTSYGVQFATQGGFDIINGIILSSSQPVPTDGQYADWTIEEMSTGYNAGTQLGILLYAVNYVGVEQKVYFDDVTVSAIPEPSTAGLFALGGWIVLARMRRRL